MTTNLVNAAPPITTPTYFRPYQLVSGTDVEQGYVLKIAGDFLGAALATSPGDLFLGVAVEKMTVGGPARSVQVAGRAAVRSGGAFARGARLTVDAQGRVVQATSGQSIIGWAEQESTGANEWVAVELALQATSVGNVLVHTFAIAAADLTAEATSETIDVVELPENARLLFVESDLVEEFAGGDAASATLAVGVAGALTQIINERNVFTGATKGLALADGARAAGTYGGEKIQARVTITGDDVADLETGEVIVRLVYAVAL